jgi:glucose-6-phosphate 1-dehydrogenase
MTIFYKAFILFDINPNSTVTLAFSIARSVDNTTLFTEKTDTIEDRENIRISGNPIFDMMMVELVKNGSINITEEELKYSDKFVDNLLEKASDEKNSVVQYANYPNLTGNPIADIALLNSAGFKYDY